MLLCIRRWLGEQDHHDYDRGKELVVEITGERVWLSNLALSSTEVLAAIPEKYAF